MPRLVFDALMKCFFLAIRIARQESFVVLFLFPSNYSKFEKSRTVMSV